jgi:3-dehydro-L-gulonate 2-dehydrogenase
MKLQYDEIKNLMEEKLLKYGCDEDIAKRSALNLASSSRDGVLSHGFYRFTRLITMIKNGTVKPNERPTTVKSMGAFEIWDGQLGMGNTNAEDAMNHAIELSNRYGIGCIAMKNTNHWMRGGAFAIQAAEKGCASICWTNTMANMAPWGATSNEIGNNPLVMGIPYKGKAIFVDGAMSQFSYGALDNAKLKGKKLSVPGGYDSEGNLSDDPKKITESGRVLPIGFWKGSAFSILMDMLVSSLSEGQNVHDIGQQGRTGIYEYGLSQIFIAIHPSNLETTDSSLAGIIASIKNAVPAEGVNEIYYPSERLEAKREDSLKNGIEVDDNIYNEVKSL